MLSSRQWFTLRIESYPASKQTVTRTVWIWAMPTLKYNQGNKLATESKHTKTTFQGLILSPRPPTLGRCMCLGLISLKTFQDLVYLRMIWSLWEMTIIRRNCIFVAFGSIWLYSNILQCISIGNRMIYSDIWHKYHEWYFEIVIRNFSSCWAS